MVIDLIGVLLALAAGTSGQLILSDPLRFLFRTSELPLISPEDLPGSQVSQELEIIGARPWSYQREFGQSMVLIRNEMMIVETDQYIVWFADPTQAVAEWDQSKQVLYPEFQLIAASTDKNKPESVLSCLTPGKQIPRECTYRAYWKHWHTIVQFYGRTDEHLPISEMQKLTDRIDQLLMSAPDRPCQGLSCTDKGWNRGSLVVIFIIVMMMVIATFGILRSQKRKELSSTSSPENLSAPFLKDELKEGSILPSPASEVVIPAPEDGQKNSFKINQIAINLLRVPITMVLMMGLILVLTLVNPTEKVRVDMALGPWLWSILLIFVGIAGGGAIGVRIAHLSWRQTVLTALFTGAGAMLISRFEISPFYYVPWDSSEGNFQFANFLIGTLAVSAPVFLLPLCDPILRQSGLAPSSRKVVFAALVITCMFVLVIPIAVGVFIGFTCFLLGSGVILSLYRPMETLGAEFGGLGLVLLPISNFAWLAYISGSFS